MNELEQFVADLHSSSTLLTKGTATIMDKDVEAVEVKNLYGQHIVWGMFSVDNRKGKFVGKLANNANTEGVSYDSSQTTERTNFLSYSL